MYEWIDRGDIRKARFARKLYVYWPDIVAVEATQKVGRPKSRRGGLQ